MATIVVEGAQEPCEFEIDDEKLELWKRIATSRGQTLSESFQEIMREFIATHPIIAQTRTPQ